MFHRGTSARARSIAIIAVVLILAAGLIYIINNRTATTVKSMAAKDFSLFKAGTSSEGVGDQPFVAAENDRLRMTLDPATLGVTLEDKATGEKIESVCGDEQDKLNTSWKGFLGSGVSIEFHNGDSPAVERADMFNRTPVKYINRLKNGFRATIVYEKLEIAFDVIVELTDDGMTAKVPADSIYEGERFRLGSIYLYPFMAATRLDEEKGYMLIPEGAGALIELEDNKGRFNAPYSKKVYGDNIAVDAEISQRMNWPSVIAPELIVMPVFGIAHTDRDIAILGIAEDGRYNSELLAYPNGVTTNYNWVTIKFLYREDYITQISRSSGIRSAPKEGDFRDVGIRFIVLSGDKTDYSGMAEAYRNYLIKNGSLAKSSTDFNIRLDFLGAESKEWIVFKSIVPMTTVSQMRTMINDLLDEGVEHILPAYKGWQKGGLSLAYGSNNYSMEGKLGREEELKELSAELREKGIKLLLYQDFLLANTERNYNASYEIVKSLSKTIARKLTNKQLYPDFLYLTPRRSISDAERFRKRFDDTGLDGIVFASVSNTLFSYFSQGAVYTREETKNAYESMINGFDGFEKAMIQPFDYLWKYTDHYYDLPLATSNYNYISREIPFLPMVLKGCVSYYAEYVNFQPNKTEFLLKMVEYGAYPSFILTWEDSAELKDTNSSDIFTSKYSDFKPAIIDYYNRLRQLSEKTKGSGISRHEMLEDDVVKVVYDNGTEIIVNYSGREFEYRQDVIAPKSYQLFEVN